MATPYQAAQAFFAWFVKFRVTLLLESGRTLVFVCDSFETKKAFDTNRLQTLNVKGQRGFPHYVDITKVDAVTFRKVSRWHRLP